MKITDQRNGRLVESERIELAKLLIKAGYTVRIGKEKQGSKAVAYIEATPDKEDTQP